MRNSLRSLLNSIDGRSGRRRLCKTCFTRKIDVKYVRVPRELHTSDIHAEEACFSPGRYVRFIPPTQKGASRYASLDKLVSVREQVVKVRKGDTYCYAEIGDINVA